MIWVINCLTVTLLCILCAGIVIPQIQSKGAVGYFARYKNAKRLIVPLEDLLMIVAKRYVPIGYMQEVHA